MTFHDVRFPTTLSDGYSGGPGFRTDIVETDGGHEERIARWSEARRRWTCARDLATQAQASELKTFFLARMGALHSFRWKDWTDYTSNADGRTAPTHLDQACGTIDGSTTQFQLYKSYVSGSQSYSRRILLPVSGTVRIGVSGSEVLSGWTVNLLTGVVTFSSAPAATPTAGFEFDCEARFGIEADRNLPMRIDAYDVATISNIPIVEVKDESPYHECADPGGGGSESFSADVTLTFSENRVRKMTPTTSGLSVFLPAPSSQMGTGGPYFKLKNGSGSNTFALRDDSGTSIKTVATGEVVECWILDNGSGTRAWEVA
ncbi:MAG: DUF2460 domain-containing protein [Planctomycetes bacterium]|nr:DUF2460 domain-containing protein [Planctomycetota bacterium]